MRCHAQPQKALALQATRIRAQNHVDSGGSQVAARMGLHVLAATCASGAGRQLKHLLCAQSEGLLLTPPKLPHYHARSMLIPMSSLERIVIFKWNRFHGL